MKLWLEKKAIKMYSTHNFFFFYQDFLSQTLITHRTAGEGRGPSFSPLYHFHPLTKFRQLFATLHVRWLSHIFNRTVCIYQAATRWDLPPYRITIWLTDDVALSFCLFTWWFDSSFFCYTNLRWETGGFELTSTITLVLQANRLTSVLVTPNNEEK